MQIDFDAITELTFDGVEITELSINNEVIWSAEPIVPSTYNLNVIYNEGSSGNISTGTIQEGAEVSLELNINPEYTYSIFVVNAEYRVENNQIIIYNAVGDVTVEILTSRVYYNLTINIEPQGSAWTDAPSTVDTESNAYFNIYPEPGYEIAYLDVDNAYYEIEENHITLFNITDDVTVNVQLREKEVNSYNLMIEVQPNNTAEVFAPPTIMEGEEVTIDVMPNAGYVLSAVYVNNADYQISGENTVILYNATGDVTVTLLLVN